jgi:succinate-semialdehyde dehydrogenase / glutarate-semialdehyde dehydrogenase
VPAGVVNAAGQIKRVSLELGGHAPFIVFPDADPTHAASGASLVKFLNTGQACISPNRIFVHRSIAGPFLSVLADRVGNLKAGNGLADGVTIGPLIDDGALAKMDQHVTDAVAKGATLVCGGQRLTGDGYEVIKMANDTIYGLAAYLYTSDLSRALRVSEALRFAIVGINDINPTSSAAPFGGMKESGLGREGGQEGITEYLETKLIGISI